MYETCLENEINGGYKDEFRNGCAYICFLEQFSIAHTFYISKKVL